jgi:8-oxo-dGTP pyrophosphatase MutT (NUDIX family)
MIQAAGILILDTKSNCALFLKRGPGGDMPGTWGIPGGRLEEGEDAQTAAIRECLEEAGYQADPKALRPWTRRVAPRETTGANPTTPPSGETVAPVVGVTDQVAILGGEQVDFTTFILRVDSQFIPVLGPSGSPEHVGWSWAPITEPPEPLHPGVRIALRRFSMHEMDVAKAIAAGELTSPQSYDNITFVDIRITGTGSTYRQKFNEHVWRDPSIYLNQDFIDRCNGLPVILEHPATSILNTKEYRKRNIGSIVVPYQKRDEIWGVARIMDASAAQMLCEDKLSTSPAVVWKDPDVNSTFKQEDGSTFLIEGKPSLLDHIAVCEHGVWDNGGPPDGVESTIVDDNTTVRGDDDMKLARINGESDDAYKARCDEMDKLLSTARADADGGKELDKVLKGIDAVATALDSTNKRLDNFEEKFKKDAETEEQKEALEKAEKAKDARKRADAFKFSKRKDEEEEDEFKERHDAEERDCADAEMEAGEPEPVALDKAKKRRRDAEEEDEKERADKSRRHDSEGSKRIDALLARIDELEGKIPAQPSDEDYNGLLAVQARADAVYNMFGKSAPRSLQGETKLIYRRRLLDGLKEHTQFKDVDLGVIAVDSAGFDVVEKQILEQADAVARSPASVPEGEMREVVHTKNGHTYTDFIGDPKTWMSGNQPVGQAVTGFGSTTAARK